MQMFICYLYMERGVVINRAKVKKIESQNILKLFHIFQEKSKPLNNIVSSQSLVMFVKAKHKTQATSLFLLFLSKAILQFLLFEPQKLLMSS